MSTVRTPLLIALFAFICRAQAPDQAVSSLIGQKFILPKISDEPKIHVKKDKIDRIKGSCDSVVEVSSASFASGVARLQLEEIGFPTTPTQPTKNVCRSGAKPSITLEISDFARDDTAAAVLGTVNKVLLTPEDYLSYRGIAFSIEPQTVAQDQPSFSDKPDANPVALLIINATYTQQARAANLNGDVLISLIVGTDGRPHSARVMRSLGMGLDENALRVVQLWRFQPGRRNGKPAPCSAQIAASFHQL